MISSHFMPIFAAASGNQVLLMMIASGAGSALLVFSILYFLMRKPKPKSEDDEIMDENGIFGRLTPGLANVIPENEKENREFRQILRQAGFSVSLMKGSGDLSLLPKSGRVIDGFQGMPVGSMHHQIQVLTVTKQGPCPLKGIMSGLLIGIQPGQLPDQMTIACQGVPPFLCIVVSGDTSIIASRKAKINPLKT